MADLAAVVQRYYGDRPLLPRIDDALRAAGVDPQAPSYRDLWPYDQLHSRGIVGTQEHRRGATENPRHPRAPRLHVTDRMFSGSEAPYPQVEQHGP